MPHLRECDPLTGEVIRASKTTAVRYERATPGDLIHVDVKKIGRIPVDTGTTLFFDHRDPAMVAAIGGTRIHD